MSKDKIVAVKGMNDILPDESFLWEQLREDLADVADQYGYRMMSTPLLEQTRLFKRGIGEVTDIVEKEMYSFTDTLNGDELSLRPEGTASIVRASIEHNLTYGRPRRVWYFGPMFRHERPQRGRCRQFHQFGVEALGLEGPNVDVEQILMVARFLDSLGLLEHCQLQINCLGQAEERAAYRQALIAYFEANIEQLDEEARRRLHTNPLRILDSKNPAMAELIAKAPVLLDSLGKESTEFFNFICRTLDEFQIPYVVNPRLVRGLDYYNLTVYEWVTDKLGAQSTICGGGRYDPLTEMLGGKLTPACGFAMGIERLVELIKEVGEVEEELEADIYVCWKGPEEVNMYALAAAEFFRNRSYSVIVDAGSGKLATQMKRADASGALAAVIIGETEAQEKTLTIKVLREGYYGYGQNFKGMPAEADEFLDTVFGIDDIGLEEFDADFDEEPELQLGDEPNNPKAIH